MKHLLLFAKRIIPTRFIALLLPMLALSSCGGGGSSSTSSNSNPASLSITFTYGNTERNPLYVVTKFPRDPLKYQLLGYSTVNAHCVLASGSLPPGYALSPSSCLVTGIPTTPGNYSAVIRLSLDGYTGSSDAIFSEIIEDIELNYTGSTQLKTGSSTFIKAAQLLSTPTKYLVSDDPFNRIGVVYKLASGSTLPPGVTLTTGLFSLLSSPGAVLQGTPTVAGIYPNIKIEGSVGYAGSTKTYATSSLTLVVSP